jgi:hypothetical protein
MRRMTVTAAERQAIIEEHEREKYQELRLRMAQLGKSRSKKKLAAARKSLAIARQVQLGRVLPKKRGKR